MLRSPSHIRAIARSNIRRCKGVKAPDVGRALPPVGTALLASDTKGLLTEGFLVGVKPILPRLSSSNEAGRPPS